MLCYLSAWNFNDWWRIFIVSNLIGKHIFLWSETQNSNACHQTLAQGLGTRLRLAHGWFNKWTFHWEKAKDRDRFNSRPPKPSHLYFYKKFLGSVFCTKFHNALLMISACTTIKSHVLCTIAMYPFQTKVHKECPTSWCIQRHRERGFEGFAWTPFQTRI